MVTSILATDALQDLLFAHIAVAEGLVPAPVAAEICLESMLRERGRSSSVRERIAEAGGFSAERWHWMNRETDRCRRALRSSGETGFAVRRAHAPQHRRPGHLAHAAGPVGEVATVMRTMPQGRYGDFVLRAQGGSALVYFCWDADLTRWVALKTLKPQDVDVNLDDPLDFRRPQEGPAAVAYQRAYDALVLEARRTARMRHPGILPVFDLGETPSGVPYYVTQRGTGLTLRDALAEGHDVDGLDVMLRVAETVAHVHEEYDLVHCDLNPGNVMLGRHGEVFVLDWGDARRPGNWTSPDGVPATGTPGWFAPELLEAACNIHASIDVYALGAMLFFVLTGEMPFADQGLVLLACTRPDRSVPPPIERIPAAYPRLADLCRQCLHPDPTKRPPNARAFAEALCAALAGRRSH